MRPAACLILLPILVGWSAGAGGHATNPPAAAYGRVASVATSARSGQPKAFSLEHERRIYAYRVSPNTRLLPRSSAAVVAGLVANDYALVIARKSYATKVLYDTVPFHPGPIEDVAGTVAKSGPQGVVRLRDLAGALRIIWRTPQTIYYLNGALQTNAVAIRVGQSLEIVAQRARRKWLAISIYVMVKSSHGCCAVKSPDANSGKEPHLGLT